MRLTLALPFLILPLAALAETVEVNGLHIWYDTSGSVTAETPYLLLHGGVMNAESTFAGLRPGLAENRPVIVVEQQAHGHTGDRDAPITLTSMRKDTIAVLDALGVEQAHVVGFSMGAMLGLELAVNAPDRVASLTAISASQDADGMQPGIIEMNETPGMEPPPEVVDLLPSEEDFAMMAEGYAENPDGPAAMDAAMAKLGALMTGGWGWTDDELAGLTMPVLIVIGDTDFILPEAAVHMAETISGAELAILPGTAHMTIMTRADWLVPMIEARIETGR